MELSDEAETADWQRLSHSRDYRSQYYLHTSARARAIFRRLSFFFSSAFRISQSCVHSTRTVNLNSCTVGDFLFAHRAARKRVTAAIFGRIIDVYAELYRTISQTWRTEYLRRRRARFSCESQRRAEATAASERGCLALERTSKTKG